MPSSHILVVDDVSTLRAILRLVLERFGFTVTEAADGREAIEQARKALPDLVLVDLEMPVLDGWQLVRALRQDSRTSDLPAIAMTVWDDVSIERAISAGFSTMLRKPFTPTELLRAITQLTDPRDEPPALGGDSKPPNASRAA